MIDNNFEKTKKEQLKRLTSPGLYKRMKFVGYDILC